MVSPADSSSSGGVSSGKSGGDKSQSSGTSGKSASNDAGKTGSERTESGSSKKDSFDAAMSNAQRPDRDPSPNTANPAPAPKGNVDPGLTPEQSKTLADSAAVMNGYAMVPSRQPHPPAAQTATPAPEESWHDDLGTRAWGAAKAAFGVGEVVLGTAGILAPEPATSVGGAVLATHGVDTTMSGWNEMVYGEPSPTLTERAATGTARALGASPGTALAVGIGIDMAAGMGNPGTAARHAGEIAMKQTMRQVAPDMATSYATRNENIVQINPRDLSFSQTTAGGKGGTEYHRANLADGWTNQPPIDAVQLSNGTIVTLDNTRPAVARELGISEIPARLHNTFDPLPADMIEISRFGRKSETWGEALQFRASGQSKPRLDLDGTAQSPKLQTLKLQTLKAEQ